MLLLSRTSAFLVLSLPFLEAFLAPNSKTASRFATTATTRDCCLALAAAKYDEVCDVLVLGSGPAARSISSLLHEGEIKVILADANHEREWAPNYGVWKDEWQAIIDRYSMIEGGKVGKSIDREWSVTDCYFGGSFDIPTEQRLRLDRPYQRVDRFALRKSLTCGYKVLAANHQSKAVSTNIYAPAGTLVHDDTGTTIQLMGTSGSTVTVRSKLIIDCTGHETSLVLKDARDKRRPPGFQIAYGLLVDVDESTSPDLSQIGPYDKEAMTLFDYRTDHFKDPSKAEKATAAPTFMYAMPLEGNRIFFEETSLVARPAVSFQECKDRCFERFEHLGIKVTNIYEEEFCYIPMGGALPAREQRIVGLGGAAAMVHPSTGYHLCRCMMGASDVAKVILKANLDGNLDQVAAECYHALWSPSNIRQRNFALFGGEFLMKQSVVGLRGFFDGFFRLSLEQWAGFLAGWPGLPNNDQHETWLARIMYGLNFVVRLPPPVAADMLASIIGYSLLEGTSLLQSVTPFFGEPLGFAYQRNDDRVGDVAAKEEARRMIAASSVTEETPVAFDVPVKTSVVETV